MTQGSRAAEKAPVTQSQMKYTRGGEPRPQQVKHDSSDPWLAGTPADDADSGDDPSDAAAADAAVLLAGRLRVNGAMCECRLTGHALDIGPGGGAQQRIDTAEMCAVVYGEDKGGGERRGGRRGRRFVVHALCVVDGKPFARLHTVITCEARCSASAAEWVALLRAASGVDNSARKPVLVFINPFGGTGRATDLFGACEPLFKATMLRYEVIPTAGPGHAFHHVRGMPPGVYSAVIAVGGDGLVSELINGIMQRPDYNTTVTSTAIGVIPGGTGNALAMTLYGGPLHMCAACHIVKGVTRPLDAFLCTQPTNKISLWGVVSCQWGLLADIDFNSEKARWLGAMREVVWTAFSVMSVPSYRGRIVYKPSSEATDWKGVFCTRDCPVCARRSASPPLPPLPLSLFTPAQVCERNSPTIEADQVSPMTAATQPPDADTPDLDVNSFTHADIAADATNTHPNTYTDAPPSHQDEHAAVEEDCNTDSNTDTATDSEETTAAYDECFSSTAVAAATAHATRGTSWVRETTLQDWDDALYMPTRYSNLFPYEMHRVYGPPPPGWIEEAGEFTLAILCKLPHMMTNLRTAPYAHLADGCMDLVYLKYDNATRWRLSTCFYRMIAQGGPGGESDAIVDPARACASVAAHIQHSSDDVRPVVCTDSKMHYHKASAFTLEPLEPEGYLGVDGELVPFAPLQFRVCPALLSVLCWH
eukprot:TRINITY_DN1443_c0_g1_i1.p1 TRINITY_DN1443_c0_g1~~TRINITY_DN1443_c0_g1_i1.p1  ORF type:complete len:731 (-),score=128.47 TRINITY_DN1443_c0_g1_i1:98-2209(-)